MDTHPDDGYALAEDVAFEEAVTRGNVDPAPDGQPLGVAFLLGVVVGVTASALLRPARSKEEGPVRGIRRLVTRGREPDEPPSLSRVVQDEAAAVARAVLRDVGRAASSWILEGLASRTPEDPSASTDGVESGP